MKNDQRHDDDGTIGLVTRYWDHLRRGQVTPYRSEVDPRRIDPALPHAFIGERIAAGHVRLRIAGSHLNELMGMEVRGMPLSSLFDPEDREALQQHLAMLFDAPAVLRLALRSPSGFRRPALEARAVLLPMRNDMGDVTRLLGCLDSAPVAQRVPRRFRLDHISVERLTARPLEPLAPEAPRQTVTGTARAPGLADPSAPFRAAPPSRHAPHLRLVHSDDRG